MNIKLCRDEKGNDMSLAETRWKPGMLTVTTTVKRKKTIDFKFSGSLTMAEVASLRDGFVAGRCKGGGEMSATSIGWTDLTLNPVIGCTHAGYQGADGKKVAHPGCTNCYAEGMCSRKLPGFTGHNKCSSKGKWTGEIEVIHDRLAWPFTRKEYRPRRDGKQRRCFLTSLSDMGHPGLAEQDWMAVQGMMLLAPGIIWQDLTKRPERQRALLEKYSPIDCVRVTCEILREAGVDIEGLVRMVKGRSILDFYSKQWSDFPHIHRYVSVSDQSTADALIPELLKMPCAVRGVSLEPMIGPVQLCNEVLGDPICHCFGCIRHAGEHPERWKAQRIDHVIVGGESGRGKRIRPFALEWALDVVLQCRGAGIPCFVKQMGSRPYIEDLHSQPWIGRWLPLTGYEGKAGMERSVALKFTGKGDNPLEWPEVLRVQQNVGDV